jgi:serine/threonine protein kinase
MGNLNLLSSSTFRCKHVLLDNRLVVKKIDCVDQYIYTQKINEIDQHARFSHHPNIMTNHSYWNENTDDPFIYRSIFVLYEECRVGDIQSCIITNPLKPSNKSIMKYTCDLAKGLSVLHQSDTIHGGLRGSNLFINHLNDLVLGPIKKCELESLR